MTSSATPTNRRKLRRSRSMPSAASSPRLNHFWSIIILSIITTGTLDRPPTMLVLRYVARIGAASWSRSTAWSSWSSLAVIVGAPRS